MIKPVFRIAMFHRSLKLCSFSAGQKELCRAMHNKTLQTPVIPKNDRRKKADTKYLIDQQRYEY